MAVIASRRRERLVVVETRSSSILLATITVMYAGKTLVTVLITLLPYSGRSDPTKQGVYLATESEKRHEPTEV